MTIPIERATGGALHGQSALGNSIAIDGTLSAGGPDGRPVDVTEQARNNNGGSDGFATAYVIVVNSLIETLFREIARARDEPEDRADQHRREEVCAAVWSTMRAGLAASLLSSEQQLFVMEAISNRLKTHWQQNLCSQEWIAGSISERAAFYLQHVDPQDPVTTAVRIVEILLESTGVPAEKRALQIRLFAGLIAHRIVSDVWLFNDWESQGKLGSARG